MKDFLFVLVSTLLSTQVFAQLPKEALQTPQLVAIQNKANYLDHDLSFEFGALPSDAFNKGITVGGSYTYFYSQYSAWEIVNLKGNINFETSLKQELLDVGVDVTNTTLEGKLDPISFILTSNYVYTPFYSKSLLFNSSILNSETSFVAGIGTVKFKTTGFQPLLNLGAYARYYTDIGRSWKFDLRWNFHSDSAGNLGNFIFIGASYSMQLGETPEHLKVKKRFE
jgi:outer membrane beta-barrel protein